MNSSPPPRSATRDGITVEVTVASKAVRRLTSERTTMMAQNLGPFWNFGGFFSVVASWASTEASFDSEFGAAGFCCVISQNRKDGWKDRLIFWAIG